MPLGGRRKFLPAARNTTASSRSALLNDPQAMTGSSGNAANIFCVSP